MPSEPTLPTNTFRIRVTRREPSSRLSMADVVQRIRREHPSLLGHAASKDNVMPPPGTRCDVGREALLGLQALSMIVSTGTAKTREIEMRVRKNPEIMLAIKARRTPPFRGLQLSALRWRHP